jgi:hypothetical protein
MPATFGQIGRSPNAANNLNAYRQISGRLFAACMQLPVKMSMPPETMNLMRGKFPAIDSFELSSLTLKNMRRKVAVRFGT